MAARRGRIKKVCYLLGCLIALGLIVAAYYWQGFWLWGAICAVALLVPTLLLDLWLAGRAHEREREAARRRVIAGFETIPVSEVSLEQAGVNKQIPDVSTELYIQRDATDAVKRHMREAHRVLLIGAPMTGKTRLALHVVKQHYRGWDLLRPARLDGDNAVVEAARDLVDLSRTVLWLDEFHQFAHPDLPSSLDRILATYPETVVVATLRTAERRRLREAPEGVKNPAAAALDWFDGHVVNDLAWSPAKQQRLEATDPRVADRVSQTGLPQFLAGGPELDAKWADATPDERAVLRLAIHWRRLGMLQHITRAVIDQCANTYLPAQHHTPCAPRVQRALNELVRPINETVSALQDMGDGYRVADHLLDREDVDFEFKPPLLDAALAAATPNECFIGGSILYKTGKLDKAAEWWKKAATHNHPAAMHNLSVYYHEQDDNNQAIDWYQKAATHNHPTAMNNLSLLYHEQGETKKAIHWWTKAANHNHTDAMYNLGVLYDELDDPNHAIHWWTKAANHDHPDAMYNLGYLYDEQGNTGQAIGWWTKAADQGYARAMCVLAHLGGLPTEEAQEWARRSREAGFDCPPLDEGDLSQS